MDETIKSRGVKVIPKEIEEVINAIKGVKEVAVIGLPDNVLDHVIIAYVACYPNLLMDETIIYDTCKKNLEKVKVPHRIIIVQSLPKSANGKINKKMLTESAAETLSKEKIYA